MNLDHPYAILERIPRQLWLSTVVSACGDATTRLTHVERWYAALLQGILPDDDCDMGDRHALQALRAVVAELALPALAKDKPTVAQQVIRTMLWNLDRLIDRPEHASRQRAIDDMQASFRSSWDVLRTQWEAVQALLQSLGDLTDVPLDALQGRLQSRAWADLMALSEQLTRVPEIVALIRALGRGVPRSDSQTSEHQSAARTPSERLPVAWRRSTIPDAPGQVHGVRLGGRLARMVSAEAAQLRHPLLRKVWRARLAESRLRVWDESAQWVEAVTDPHSTHHAALASDPTPRRERGPMILCVDTSGSMRGAPEKLAKAVVLEAARTAHRERRACHVIAFGGPREVVELSLSLNAQGLDALLAFADQGFDGGTDIALPIERAIERTRQAGWREADVLIVSDGEFGLTPATLAQLDLARQTLGLRVQGLLIGDRETMGLLEAADAIHWVRDWRRFDAGAATPQGFSPVHSQSLTALYFPNALSERATRTLQSAQRGNTPA